MSAATTFHDGAAGQRPGAVPAAWPVPRGGGQR
jgi:hypothetical protein